MTHSSQSLEEKNGEEKNAGYGISEDKRDSNRDFVKTLTEFFTYPENLSDAEFKNNG